MNRNRWRLKGCPRCGGDIFIETDMEKDLDEVSEHCLQCGYETIIVMPDITKRSHGKGIARHNYKIPVEV